MSIININVEDATATHVLPDGEHRVTINSAIAGKSKNSGREQVALIFEPTDDPYAEVIRDYLPTEAEADPRRENRRLLRWAAFAGAFDVSLQEADPEDWVGSVGYVTVSTEYDSAYGEQNRVRSYVAGH